MEFILYVALISAMLIIPAGAFRPEIGATTYTVYGFVRESGTGHVLPGAIVILYKIVPDIENSYRVKVASKVTDNYGYYKFTTVQSSQPMAWEVTVSKSGYEPATKRVACRLTSTNMGTVYLTPAAPPLTPVIVVTQSEWYNYDCTLDWLVNWGTPMPGTSYSVELYWGTDSDFSGETPIKTWSGSANFYSHVFENIPHRGEWWFEIQAKAWNNYGTSEANVTRLSAGVILPIADTYVVESTPNSNRGLYNFLITAKDGYRSYLKFDVPNYDMVESASLFAYHQDLDLQREVTAYKVSYDWDELSLTWNSQPDLQTLVDIDYPGLGLDWGSWDVTDLVKEDAGKVSVALIAEKEPYVVYSSRECGFDVRPHLLVQYRVDFEEHPWSPSEHSLIPAISDDFGKEQLSDFWIPEPIGDPDYGYQTANMSSWTFDGRYLEIGPATETDQDITGWSFSQPVTYRGAFHFEITTKYANDHYQFPNGQFMPQPLCETGIKIYNGEMVVCAVENYGTDWINGNRVKAWDCTGQSVTRMGNFPYGITPLILHRDPGSDIIEIWAPTIDDTAPIMETPAGLAITRIELFYQVDPTELGGLPYASIAGFFYFLDVPIEIVWKPVYQSSEFNSPIKDASFESSNPLNYWNKEMTVGSPDSGLYVMHDPDDNIPHSLSIRETDGLYRWAIAQQLQDDDDDQFDYASLSEHYLEFSFFAHSGSTDSRIRAVLRYWTENEGPFAISGPWTTLKPSNDNWTEITVVTHYRLPQSIQKVELRIEGEGVHDEKFSGNVDHTQLILLSGVNQDTEPGQLLMTLPITYSDVEEQTYTIDTWPHLQVTANPGYYVKQVSMEVEVTWQDPAITNQVDLLNHQFIEGNDIGYEYTAPQDWAQWYSFWSGAKNVAKWILRGCILPWGGTAGLSAPYSWIASEISGLLFDGILASWRNPDDGSTYGDGHAHEDVPYPTNEGFVMGCELGGAARWTLGWGENPPSQLPMYKITYIVDWGMVDPGDFIQYSRTSTISMFVACL